MNAYWPSLLGVGLCITIGCSGPGTMEKTEGQSVRPVVEMLHQAIIELNVSIEELTKHISELQQMPPSSDPNIQELHALDLAGWQLHLQQWILQRDHLLYTVKQIQQVQRDAGEKSAVGVQWRDRQQQFIKTMEELTANRQKLERKRLETETQVIGQYFQ